MDRPPAEGTEAGGTDGVDTGGTCTVGVGTGTGGFGTGTGGLGTDTVGVGTDTVGVGRLGTETVGVDTVGIDTVGIGSVEVGTVSAGLACGRTISTAITTPMTAARVSGAILCAHPPERLASRLRTPLHPLVIARRYIPIPDQSKSRSAQVFATL